MSTFAKYPKATAITIYSLGCFLGLLHIFFGVISLTPMLNQDYHREMKINYNAFAKILLNLTDVLDRVTVATYLRYCFASFQLIFGSFLVENGHFGPLGKIGNYGLIVLDLFYLLFQLNAGTSYERVAPTAVFAVLLVTRLLIVEQGSKKVKVGVKTRNAGKPKTSTPKKNKNE